MLARARRVAFAFCLGLGALTTAAAPLLTPSPALAQMPSEDAKYAAIVIDAATGEVLYAKRADSPRYPASITKIMTLYLAFEAIQTGRMKLTDTIMVSPHATAQAPSKLGVPAGERISVEDAIRAICVKSANDMAVAMAEHLGGTESRFAALMTLKAHELGMVNSRFVNASGLPDARQLTSARDIAILSRAVMHDFPQFYPYFSTKVWGYRGQNLKNHNGLLFKMPGVDGIKTGYTNASGFNLAASAVRDGRRLITVVMGGPSTKVRDAHVEELLDTGFDVLRRRKAGEQIAVAQPFFEHAVATPSTGSVYGQSGKVPELPEGVVPVEPSTLQTATNEAPPKFTRSAPHASKASLRKKKDPSAIWVIQVGSFKAKAEARDWLRETTERFGQRLMQAEARVIPSDGWYRTRFEGLTKAAASEACRALKSKRLPCIMMRD